MMRRGWAANTWRASACAALGFTAALGLAWAPGLRLSPHRWPASGALGVFTWIAWFVSTGLAITLALVAVVLRLRSRLISQRGWMRRLVLAAAGFALLAALAFLTASQARFIEHYPIVALVLALAALAVLRRLVLATSPVTMGSGARTDESQPSPQTRGTDEETEAEEAAARSQRRMERVATLMASLLLIVVAIQIAVSWLGPGLGVVIETKHPTPFFWGEPLYFEYDAKKRARADVSEYLRSPDPGSSDATRRTVLPAGTRLSIKDLVENGAQVRIEGDPSGRLVGEWGYVRYSDLGD